MSDSDTNPWGPPGQDEPPRTPGTTPPTAQPAGSPTSHAEVPAPRAPQPAPVAPAAIPPYVPAHPPDVDPEPFEKAAPMLSWGASEDEPSKPIVDADATAVGAGGGGGRRFPVRLIGLAVVLLVAVVVAATTFLGGNEKAAPKRNAAIAPTQVENTSPDIAQPKEITATTAEDQLNGGHIALKVTHKQLLRTRPAANGRLIRVVGSKTPYGGPNVLPIVKARGDWVAVVSPYRKQNNKVSWTKVAPNSKFVAVEYSISIRLSKHTIVVRKNGKIVHRFNTAIGRVGHATPTGRFSVTDGLLFKVGDRAIYGCCALVLSARQPNLPAGWTGGDRIAMHGTPNKNSIGLAASLGCLRVGDEASRWLVSKVPAGATVFIKP